MAVITRMQGTGSEHNTPWAQVIPQQSGGSLIQNLAYALGYRAAHEVRGSIETNDAAVTLNTGSTTADIYAIFANDTFVEQGVTIQRYNLIFVIDSSFMDYDEVAQDAAQSTNISFNVGGNNYSVAESDAGVTFDSDTISIGTATYFYMRFTQASASETLGQLFAQLRVI